MAGRFIVQIRIEGPGSKERGVPQNSSAQPAFRGPRRGPGQVAGQSAPNVTRIVYRTFGQSIELPVTNGTYVGRIVFLRQATVPADPEVIGYDAPANSSAQHGSQRVMDFLGGIPIGRPDQPGRGGRVTSSGIDNCSVSTGWAGRASCAKEKPISPSESGRSREMNEKRWHGYAHRCLSRLQPPTGGDSKCSHHCSLFCSLSSVSLADA
jgi:hypothetical protein